MSQLWSPRLSLAWSLTTRETKRSGGLTKRLLRGNRWELTCWDLYQRIPLNLITYQQLIFFTLCHLKSTRPSPIVMAAVWTLIKAAHQLYRFQGGFVDHEARKGAPSSLCFRITLLCFRFPKQCHQRCLRSKRWPYQLLTVSLGLQECYILICTNQLRSHFKERSNSSRKDLG